jgi:hypothetical protein
MSVAPEKTEPLDSTVAAVANKKDERRRILASPKYNRMGFKAEVHTAASTSTRPICANLAV